MIQSAITYHCPRCSTWRKGMICEHIKKRILIKLTEEIEYIDPASLEQIGHNVISVIEGQSLIHHGINKDYMPCKSTVDSFSNDSTIVGEYSTDKNYFKSSRSTKSSTQPIYKKINTDITHANGHTKPNGPDKIYLVSSRVEPPSFRSNFNSTPLAQSFGEKIIFLDARELAKHIYNQTIDNQTYATCYKEFFPEFRQNLNNYEYYGKVPAQCEGHILSNTAIDAINAHYEHHNICMLYGVSGSGKTQAAIDFIHENKNDFENYLWISGEDWKQDTPLSAIQRSRGGTAINVAGIFNTGKTILVLDNIGRELDKTQFAELNAGFIKGSVVLATSQIGNPTKNFYLGIPSLSEDVALQILGEKSISVTDLCKNFIRKCLSFPIILSTARNMITQQGIPKEELYREVLNSPDVVSGADGTSIMRQILKKLGPNESNALTKIANSGCTTHDLTFLRHFIGISVCSTLQRLSILMPTAIPNTTRIHDLVCLAAQNNLSSTDLVKEIEEYISAENGDMKPSILKQIHLSFTQLSEEHARRGKRIPDWLTYALLQIERKEKHQLYDSIHSMQFTAELTLASIMCIVDAKEAYSYTIEDHDKRKSYYRECAEIFRKAFLDSSCDDIKAELLYHRAKALRRCGEDHAALTCFKEHLDIRPKWHATHGQIAHLGSKKVVAATIKKEGKESMLILIDNILQDAPSIPLRVSLAAIAKMRSYRDIASVISTNSDQVQKLADIIATSALEGLDQFYEAFVSFTSIFGYHHSLCCMQLANSLPEILAIAPEFVEKRQWVSACEALSNISTTAKQEANTKLSQRSIEASIRFADEIYTKEELKAYDARAIAKAYLAAELPQKALNAIAKVPATNIDHWLLYRKTIALLQTNASSKAVNTATNALDLALQDTGAKHQISAYHSLLSSCHEAAENYTDALSEAQLALKKCSSEKYKHELQKKIDALANFAS